MKRTHRAGVSIAEMCIVLALLAIVGTLVVSFSAMVSARASAATTRLNAADDLKVSQVVLENWVDQMTALDAQFTVGETGLSATVGTETYTVSLLPDTLRAPLPDGHTLTCPISAAETFRFDQMTRADGNPLIFCTLTYTVKSSNGAGHTVEETFTVLSRVGETLS